MMECLPSDRLTNCLQRFRADRRREGDALIAVPDRLPRPESIAKKVEGLDWKIPTSIHILAIDELRLLRVQSEPAGREPDLQGAPQCTGLFFAAAMTDDIVRVRPLPGDKNQPARARAR
jgi:hypothetical protein